MKIRSFLRPNFLKLAILILALSLTLLIVTEREATSKVSWQEKRGAPLSFLTLVEYRGPCPPSSFCAKVRIRDLHFSALLIDILGWYIISCAVFLVFRRVFRH
jgi:hypothetical protein